MRPRGESSWEAPKIGMEGAPRPGDLLGQPVTLTSGSRGTLPEHLEAKEKQESWLTCEMPKLGAGQGRGSEGSDWLLRA